MNERLIWLYIIGGCFAALGVVDGSALGFGGFLGGDAKPLIDLTNTLKDAAEVAKAYREDVQILQADRPVRAQPPNFGDEPESIIPQSTSRPGPAMPSPYWDGFR